jgi:hypothetical protein
VIAVIAGLSALVVVPAFALQQRPAASARPTLIEAHNAVHIAFDNYVDVTHSEMFIRGCSPLGERSSECDVRIAGRVPQVYRVVVTKRPEDYQVFAALLR